MNSLFTRIIATTLLASASVCAMAQTTSQADAERDWDNMHARNQYPIIPFKSSKTRAEVKAELIAAQHAGTITNGDDYPVLPQASSHKTRAQVQAELVAARQAGLISNGDDYPVMRPTPSLKTRAQVEAEVASARQAAQLAGENAY